MRCVPMSLLVAATAASQANWLVQSPALVPPACEAHSMVYDPATQRTFTMWGTLASGLPNFAIHMWNGTNWTPCTYGTVGGAFLMVSRDVALTDDGGGGLLMFGGWRPGFGIGGGTPIVLDQTWRAVANTSGVVQFTLLSPPVRPAARQGASMVRTNQGVLLFGGCGINGIPTYGDTWRWNGATWTQLAPAASPSARVNAAMAFDAARNVAVLFGGYGGSGDTWEFDGVVWLLRSPAPSPSPRGRAAFAWSPGLGRCVLYGGSAVNGGVAYGDTWTWDGTDWHLLYPIVAPAARQGATLCYDPGRQQPLLFGGRQQATYFADTHYLGVLSSPSTYTPFGAGCAGPTAPVPSLTVAPNELPRLGTTSHLLLGNLPVGVLTLPVFVLGLSNTWEPSASHPLPFDLGFLGWPGCQQLVSHDVMLPMPTLAGQVTHAIGVPVAPSLLGFTFHAQGFVLYQPTGAAVSNAITGVVGT